MSKRISIGWGVLVCEVTPNQGRTICSYPHRLFSSKLDAKHDAAERRWFAGNNPRFSFDVVEVFIHDPAESP
jgi:hypothetical protein